MLDQLYYPVKNVSNKKKVENHECPVIIRYIRQWFFSDRYPVGYYPILSGIRENGIRYIPTQ